MLGRLVVTGGPFEGVVVEIRRDMGRIVVGRSGEADLPLDDTLISRTHMALYVREGKLFVEDLGSNNGTFVDGLRIEAPTPVNPGATVRAGSVVFTFKTGGDRGRERGEFTGRKIGRYRVGEKIGEGGMGEVYKAVQEGLGRPAALKILSPELAGDREYVARFIREARAAGSIDHPNVIHVYDAGEENGVYYYSMEYVDGGSLQDRIAGNKALPQQEAARIALEVARALEYAESKGIVHCDVKPDNIMLASDGRVKLADLGIAKRVSSGTRTDADPLGVFGSPHFMSPEQAMGKPLDNRTDIYSLGATMYRMLTGRTLFPDADSRTVMEQQVYEEPEDILSLNPALHPGLAALVRGMLSKQRGRRPRSASVVVKTLEELIPELRSATGAALPASPRPRRGTARKSHFLPLLVVSAAVVFLLAAAGHFIISSRYISNEEAAALIDRAGALIENGRPREAVNLIDENMPEARPEHRVLLADLRRKALEKETFLRERDELLERLDDIASALPESATIPELMRLSRRASAEEGRAGRLGLSDRLAAIEAAIREKASSLAGLVLARTRAESAFLCAAWRFGQAEKLWTDLPPGTADLTGADPDGLRSAVSGKASALRAFLAGEAVRLRSQGAEGLALRLLSIFSERSGLPKPEAPPEPAGATPANGGRAAFLAALAAVEEGMYRFNKAASSFRLLASELEREGKTDASRDAAERARRLNGLNAAFLSLVGAANDLPPENNSVTLADGRSFNLVRADREEIHLEGDTSRLTMAWGVLPPEQFFSLAASASLPPGFHLDFARYALELGLPEAAAALARRASTAKPSLQQEAREIVSQAAAVPPESRLRREKRLAETTRRLLFLLLDEGRLDDAFFYYSVLEHRFDRGRGIVSKEELDEIRKDLEEKERSVRLRSLAVKRLEEARATAARRSREYAAQALRVYSAENDLLGKAQVLLAAGDFDKALEVLRSLPPSLRKTPPALLFETIVLAAAKDAESQIEAVRNLPELERNVRRLPPSLASLAGRLDLFLSAGDAPSKVIGLAEEALSKAPSSRQAHERIVILKTLLLPFPSEWIAARETARLLDVEGLPSRVSPQLALGDLLLRRGVKTAGRLLSSEDPFLRFLAAETLRIAAVSEGRPVPEQVRQVLLDLKTGFGEDIYLLPGEEDAAEGNAHAR